MCDPDTLLVQDTDNIADLDLGGRGVPRERQCASGDCRFHGPRPEYQWGDTEADRGDDGDQTTQAATGGEGQRDLSEEVHPLLPGRPAGGLRTHVVVASKRTVIADTVWFWTETGAVAASETTRHRSCVLGF